MTEIWVAIIAAAAALGGAFVGFLGGRRQIRGQGFVEHGHWIREQRLQAYTELLDVWDTIVEELVDFQRGWNDLVMSLRESGLDPHPRHAAEDRVKKLDQLFLRPLDRVELLGPDGINEGTIALRGAWSALVSVVPAQGRGEPFSLQTVAWERAKRQADKAREDFFVEAAVAVRQPPDPRTGPT